MVLTTPCSSNRHDSVKSSLQRETNLNILDEEA